MLSYQHAYHAGNLADVHKHGLVACVLDYLVQKDKALTYIETHGGRGLYDLQAPEALKTGEAAAGIISVRDNLPADHPYSRVLDDVIARYGTDAYPGSPLLAALMLRSYDRIHVAEMHPREVEDLRRAMKGFSTVKVYAEDGLKMANGLIPPEPRRGVMLIDPSYEVKTEYDDMADFITRMHKKWPVGTIALWYPLLQKNAHKYMLEALERQDFPKTFRHEVTFPVLRPGHGMCGSGMFFINAPHGLEDQAREIECLF